jgi:flagellar biogenesis protein FliO
LGAGETPVSATPVASGLAGAGVSLVRLLGAFALVLAIVLGAVWLMRNSGRFVSRSSVPRKLNVLEVRFLGNRQSLMVVGYEEQRLLLATSPAGIVLLTPLRSSDVDEVVEPGKTTPMPSFLDTLQQAWGGRS